MKKQMKLFIEYYIKIMKNQLMISKNIEIIKILFLKEIIKILSMKKIQSRIYLKKGKNHLINKIFINIILIVKKRKKKLIKYGRVK